MPFEFEYIEPFEYEIGWRDIVNDVRIPVEERVPDPEITTVWESTDTITLAAGESRDVAVESSDPFMQAQPVTQVDGDIVSIGAGTVTANLSRTSGQSTTIRLTSTGGSATVTFLRLRARAVRVARTTQVVLTDSTSITRHGDRTYPQDVPWVSQHDALAVAQVLLAQYAQRRSTIGVRFASGDEATHLQEVTRTISDLITIRNSVLGLDADFYIETIGHTLVRMVAQADCPGPVHYATFGCEQAGTGGNPNPFTFDKVGAGFNDGYFGPNIADDPTTLFIFDHPTQGQFDVGRFAT